MKISQIAVAGACLLFAGCTNNTGPLALEKEKKAGQRLIQPPIDGVNVPFAEMAIDPTKDQVLRPDGSKGSSITIPAGSLVDASGKPVRRPVTVRYREFHDAADLFVSGIPMSMKVNGSTEQFETAGMFEIRAEDNQGNPVFVKDGAAVTVKMGSMRADSTFRFFYLDEQQGNWAYQGEADPEINNQRVEMEREMIARTPKHAVPFSDEYAVLDYNSLIDILANDNYRMIEVLQNSPKVKQKLTSYNLRRLDVSLYATVNFRGRNYPADALVWKVLGKDPLKGEVKSCTVHPQGNDVYRFVVEYYDGRKFKGNFQAVMTAQELFARDAGFWKEQYDVAMAEVKELERRIAEKEVVYRTFEIAGFGIYNWDKFISKEGSKPVLVHTPVTFSEPLSKTEDLRANHFFLVGPDKNSMIRLNPDVYFRDSLYLQALPGSMIITNLEGGKLAVFEASQYNSIPFTGLRAKQTIPLHFTVKEGKVESVEDVRRALGI
jgi:hypothetical protein